MSEYIISLENDPDKEEAFEMTGDNIALVHVMDNSGNDITQNCRVQITLSKNALLGLGTELIRLAHDEYKNGRHFHLDPIEKEYVVQSMGIMLHPESCELILGCGDFDSFTEYTKEEV
ncbi:hypothetical protein [Psychrobacillus sp. FJAT-21963]|uniref:Imm32 family immunity protein n=1 Tax=Psychrobacillus sp. FJAT-21963 TaxID=1712028 RepID=UPI0006F47411|nr:hypothetical protein [Psychrobacillus sp. FJAT-21963]KQL27364.1 hypothetical protein AN959_20285 [Psychrobacillus sp. FJAT-21963]